MVSHSTSEGNLGVAERRKRWILGAIAVPAAFGLAIAAGAGSFYGATVLFMLFWVGVLGLLQAKEKT